MLILVYLFTALMNLHHFDAALDLYWDGFRWLDFGRLSENLSPE